MAWLLLTLLLALPTQDGLSLPDGIAGERARAFLAMYASGTAEDIREFEWTHRVSNGISVRQRVEYLVQLRSEYGELEPVRVLSTEPLVVLAHSEHKDEYVTLGVLLQDEAPRRLIGVRIRESYSPALHDLGARGWEDLDDLLTGVREVTGVPAIAAAVVTGEHIRDAACVGLRRADGTEPAALDARFHAGSLGKAMTAVLVAKLVEEGELSWDTTLAEVLTDVEMREEWEDVDLRLLLQHRSGLLRDGVPSGWDGLSAFTGSPVEQRHALARWVLARAPAFPPGSTVLYSNAGYGLAGHLVEVRLGKPWEELIVERVFQPLGMVRAGTGPAACAERPDEPCNHTWPAPGEAGCAPIPREFADIYLPAAVAPAGDVHLSIGDLATWALFHLEGLRGESAFLSAQSFRRLHTPPGGLGYAMGWSVGWSPDGHVEHSHSGSDGSSYAHIALYPRLDLGVVILLNVAPSPDVTGAVRMITASARERFDPKRQAKQDEDAGMLGPEQSRADLAVLRKVLTEAHAGALRYTSASELERLLDEAETQVDRPLTQVEFYRVVARVLAALRCGHTAVQLSDAAIDAEVRPSRFVPLEVRFLADGLYVQRHLVPEPSIETGTRIVAFDGRPTEEVVEELFMGIRTDGTSRAGKARELEQLFYLYYRLLIGAPDQVSLTLADEAGGGTHEVVVETVPLGVLSEERRRPFGPEPKPSLHYEALGDARIGVLRVGDFLDLGLPGFLTDAFERIEADEIEDLVLDLRDNPGGWDHLGALLVSHLVDEPFRFYRGLEYRAQDLSSLPDVELDPEEFAEYAPLPAGGPLTEPGRLGALLDHYCTSHPGLALQTPTEPGYRGRLWVLQNGGSRSSGSEAAALLHGRLHERGRGTFVGQETGGGYQGVNAGVLVELDLPNSGLTLQIPLVLYRNAVPAGVSMGGVPTDESVFPTVESLRAEIDGELDATIRLIEEDRAGR